MSTLGDTPGTFRSGGVGIYRGDQLIHMAPPANRVPKLMDDLLNWLHSTKEHPLVAGCVFHYELDSSPLFLMAYGLTADLLRGILPI